jgi:hypothetical protein
MSANPTLSLLRPSWPTSAHLSIVHPSARLCDRTPRYVIGGCRR